MEAMAGWGTQRKRLAGHPGIKYEDSRAMPGTGSWVRVCRRGWRGGRRDDGHREFVKWLEERARKRVEREIEECSSWVFPSFGFIGCSARIFIPLRPLASAGPEPHPARPRAGQRETWLEPGVHQASRLTQNGVFVSVSRRKSEREAEEGMGDRDRA